MVRRYAESDSPRIIENASIEHAREIVRQLFRSAIRHREDVRIVTGALLDEFYRDLVEDAKEVLGEVLISVIVLSKTPGELKDNDFFNLVEEHDNGKVMFRYSRKPGQHFILVGTSRYRIEIDDSKTTAFASFNDAGFGALLSRLFDGLEKSA